MKAKFIEDLGKSLLEDVNSTLAAGFEETRTETFENGNLVSVKVVRKHLTPRRRQLLEGVKHSIDKAVDAARATNRHPTNEVDTWGKPS